MITYFTYFDHIERAGYVPELIVEHWDSCDRRIVFTSCESEIDVMKERHVDAELINIGIGINIPSDIPIALNACTDWCYAHGADNTVLIIGDQYLTIQGDDVVRDFICNGGKIGYLNTIHVLLYSYQWGHPNQLLVTSKDRRLACTLRGDGQELDWQPEKIVDDDTLLLDIGYMGCETYRKHIDNHRYIWGSPDEWYKYKLAWLDTYNRDRDEAIRMAYRNLKESKGRGLEPIDFHIYEELIGKMGLTDDYHRCVSIIKEFI